MSPDTEVSPNNGTLSFYRGALYVLSPLNIPLSLVVLIHNTLIIRSYWRDRSRVVPLLFILIAGLDLLLAQGQLFLSIVSILLYTGHLAPSRLAPCLVYYQGTGAIGGVLSKVVNTILTVFKTINIVFPFRRLDPGLLKKITLGFCLVPLIFTLLDTAGSLYVAVTHIYIVDKEINILVFSTTMPVAEFLLGLFCGIIDKYQCDVNHRHITAGIVLGSIIFSFYILLPCLVFIAGMVFQVRFLYKNLGNSDNPLLKGARDIAITVCLITVLFFLCHVVLYISLMVLGVIVLEVGSLASNKLYIGVLLGLGEYTLPLINVAVFPFILIFRKDDLRKKYLNAFEIVWRKAGQFCL